MRNEYLLTVGDDNWTPTQEELTELVNQFQRTDLAPVGVIAPAVVRPLETRKVLHTDDEYKAAIEVANHLCDLKGDSEALDSMFNELTDMIGDYEDLHPCPILDDPNSIPMKFNLLLPPIEGVAPGLELKGLTMTMSEQPYSVSRFFSEWQHQLGRPAPVVPAFTDVTHLMVRRRISQETHKHGEKLTYEEIGTLTVNGETYGLISREDDQVKTQNGDLGLDEFLRQQGINPNTLYPVSSGTQLDEYGLVEHVTFKYEG